MVIDNETLLGFFASKEFRRSYLEAARRCYSSVNMFELASGDVASYVAGHRNFLQRYTGERMDLLIHVLPALGDENEKKDKSPVSSS